ncbi:hypothetical protein ALC56_08517 [Trachymyrmex septentrionalis]|uniref:Uncharacterized protein n=1 Tax=Trachymyrmex septentrionalis TaxID=34720 RepID=A0A195F8M3_9HYME|nr:hypothetical protein ALC56_08517 [Trachymyrmex septentrionalis]
MPDALSLREDKSFDGIYLWCEIIFGPSCDVRDARIILEAFRRYPSGFNVIFLSCRNILQQRSRGREKQIEISSRNRTKLYEFVDIEKQIESECCRKRWISVCTCIALPQILSTNSLLTLFPAYIRCRALSISRDVRRNSHCGEKTSGHYCKETAWREHEINALNRQNSIFIPFS